MYGKILTAIEANNFDNFRKRAYISKTEKLLTLPFSYAKSLNPGDVNLVSATVVVAAAAVVVFARSCIVAAVFAQSTRRFVPTHVSSRIPARPLLNKWCLCCFCPPPPCKPSCVLL